MADEKMKQDAALNEAAEVKEEAAEEIIIYGKAAIDGVALPSKELVNATEDFPVVLVVGEDFIPIKKGEEVKTPYDAVLPMDMIQKIGPMIRVIYKVESMTNVEAL